MILFDISSFFGRLHPLIVHLPIGFIIIEIILEWYLKVNKIYISNKILSFIWFLAFISSIFAVFFGWLLASNGHYAEDNIYLHRWSGILLVFFILFIWGLKSKMIYLFKSQNSFFNFLIIIILLIVSHQGGKITHGENYILEYSPEFIKKKFYNNTNTKISYKDKELDSIEIFKELILPIFEHKCISCHNNEIQMGELNMTTVAKLFKGGSSGNAIINKNAEKSILFNRITLPQNNNKFMPPNSNPLTYDEINLIKWWLNSDIKSNNRLSSVKLEKTDKWLLNKLFEIDTKEKPFYDKLKNISKLDYEKLKRLDNVNFTWKILAENYPLIELNYIGNNIEDTSLNEILKFNENIIALTIKDSNLKDSHLKLISKLKNLMILNIQNNPITDKGVIHLGSLKNIEKLNLYGTKISNISLNILSKIKSLKTIYLWRTKVSIDKINEFNNNNSTKVILGV